MRATEHAPHDPFNLLERRHGFAEIVERGAGVHAAAANATTLMVHGVPRLSVDALPADVRAKIARFTAQDYEVYAAGFRRFAEAAGVVEAATGTQVLCARDIQPATRSALGATAAGRRLVAALDAGSLPRPTPGLLPRRADGVDPVPCSFH